MNAYPLDDSGIHFGTKMSRLHKRHPKARATETAIQGYYFVLPNGGRHWFGETFDEARKSFEDTADRLLTDDHNQYWIDYCFGYATDERLAWQNLDLTDKFLD